MLNAPHANYSARPMNILVYGAGVIGSLYAGRLQRGGQRVTLLARGQRRSDVDRHGLVLEDLLTGARSAAGVETVERLVPDDHYHLVIVTVRRDQLDDVLPELSANRQVPTFLFMLNNPIGLPRLIESLGERVLLGFPGAGGTREGHTVRYAMIAQQPTTVGEPDGHDSIRLDEVVKAFRASGFKTRQEHNMDAWLKAHAFFVTAIGAAIYLAAGNCQQLSKDRATLRLMVNGVREGFEAVQALGLPVTPFALKLLFNWLPPAFAVSYWQRFFATDTADYIFGRHSRDAFAEMRELADDCRIILRSVGTRQSSLHQLYAAIDSYVAHSAPCVGA
jgi:2-dehydropantoate 2-reductase